MVRFPTNLRSAPVAHESSACRCAHVPQLDCNNDFHAAMMAKASIFLPTYSLAHSGRLGNLPRQSWGKKIAMQISCSASGLRWLLPWQRVIPIGGGGDFVGVVAQSHSPNVILFLMIEFPRRMLIGTVLPAVCFEIIAVSWLKSATSWPS